MSQNVVRQFFFFFFRPCPGPHCPGWSHDCQRFWTGALGKGWPAAQGERPHVAYLAQGEAATSAALTGACSLRNLPKLDCYTTGPFTILEPQDQERFTKSVQFLNMRGFKIRRKMMFLHYAKFLDQWKLSNGPVRCRNQFCADQ